MCGWERADRREWRVWVEWVEAWMGVVRHNRTQGTGRRTRPTPAVAWR